MKRMMILAAMGLACCGVFASAARSQETAKGDPRVRQSLDKLGIPFQVTAEGDFEIDDGTVIVRVESEPRKLVTWDQIRPLELRRIASVAYQGPFSNELITRLLTENRKSLNGAWMKNGDLAIFYTDVPPDLDHDGFVTAMLGIHSAAKKMKQQLAENAP